MHLLKAQKVKTSSACPKDSMERSESSCSPTQDSQPGPHTLAQGACPWRGHQAEPAKTEQFSRKDLTVLLTSAPRAGEASLKNRSLFSYYGSFF